MTSTITINLGTITAEQLEDVKALLIGVVLPWLIAAINQRHWSSQARILVAVIVSMAVAFLETAITNTLTPANVSVFALKLFFAATVSYRALAKNFGIKQFEERTSHTRDEEPAQIKPERPRRTPVNE